MLSKLKVYQKSMYSILYINLIWVQFQRNRFGTLHVALSSCMPGSLQMFLKTISLTFPIQGLWRPDFVIHYSNTLKECLNIILLYGLLKLLK